MHGYRFPQHEKAIAAIARRIGFLQVSVSHEVSPLMKLVSRGDTTVVDAYLSPILRRYVGQVEEETEDGEGRRHRHAAGVEASAVGHHHHTDAVVQSQPHVGAEAVQDPVVGHDPVAVELLAEEPQPHTGQPGIGLVVGGEHHLQRLGSQEGAPRAGAPVQQRGGVARHVARGGIDGAAPRRDHLVVPHCSEASGLQRVPGGQAGPQPIGCCRAEQESSRKSRTARL